MVRELVDCWKLLEERVAAACVTAAAAAKAEVERIEAEGLTAACHTGAALSRRWPAASL